MAATKKALAAKAARQYNPQVVIASQEKQIAEMATVIQTMTAKLNERSSQLKTYRNVIDKLANWLKHFKNRKTEPIIILKPEPEDFGTIVGAISTAAANNCFIIVDTTQELIAKKQIALIMKEKTLPLPISFK